MDSTPVSGSTREEVLDLFRNQTIQINGLQSAFETWINPVNVQLPWLRTELAEWIIESFPLHPNLAKLLRCDFAFFGAAWYPFAEKTQLMVATMLAVWLFVWDDAADHGDNVNKNDGASVMNYDQAENFRQTTYKYIKSCLGLSELFVTNDYVIKSFEGIGRALRQAYSEAQRLRFLSTMELFITQQRVEQEIRLGGKIPTPDEFWCYRLGTSAVKIAIEMNEYCNKSNLSTKILEDERMVGLCKNANVNFCAVNDLVSLRKEIASNSIESIVPILVVNKGITVQTAVENVMDQFIKQSITNIDFLAAELIRDYEDLNSTEDLATYIRGCKNLCVANITWSLITDRYGLGVVDGEGDDISVRL